VKSGDMNQRDSCVQCAVGQGYGIGAHIWTCPEKQEFKKEDNNMV